MSDSDDIIPAQDRIEGAKAIATFLGVTARQVCWRIMPARVTPNDRFPPIDKD